MVKYNNETIPIKRLLQWKNNNKWSKKDYVKYYGTLHGGRMKKLRQDQIAEINEKLLHGSVVTNDIKKN